MTQPDPRPRRIGVRARWEPWTIAIALCCACGGAPSGETPPPAADVPAAAEPSAAQVAEEPQPPGPYKARRDLMGTVMEMTVLGLPQAQAAAAVDAAMEQTRKLEAVLSEWKPDSEVSQINAAAGKHPVKVGPHTLAVVRAGVEVSRWSEGAFDLSWAALRGLYLFQRGEEKVPTLDEIKPRLPLIRYQDIVIDEQASTVMLKREGMKIGTGGIAKGYALDVASQILRDAGAESFMFFGGGQVQVHGLKGKRPWRVGIQHPRRNDYFGFIQASEGSVSTSGDYEHAFVRDGKRWHHLLNPRTGLPVDHTMSVTLIADSGLYADAMSTAVFILGAERALPMLAGAPGNPRVALVDASGKLFISDGMDEQLVLRAPLVDGKIPSDPPAPRQR